MGVEESPNLENGWQWGMNMAYSCSTIRSSNIFFIAGGRSSYACRVSAKCVHDPPLAGFPCDKRREYFERSWWYEESCLEHNHSPISIQSAPSKQLAWPRPFLGDGYASKEISTYRMPECIAETMVPPARVRLYQTSVTIDTVMLMIFVSATHLGQGGADMSVFLHVLDTSEYGRRGVRVRTCSHPIAKGLRSGHSRDRRKRDWFRVSAQAASRTPYGDCCPGRSAERLARRIHLAILSTKRRIDRRQPFDIIGSGRMGTRKQSRGSYHASEFVRGATHCLSSPVRPLRPTQAGSSLRLPPRPRRVHVAHYP